MVDCFVKRDDELGCGISGTKLRKYSSLMPALLNQGIRHLAIIAGPQSNNLLAALQMAREYQLGVTAFLIKPKHEQRIGNFKLSSLFLREEETYWVSREDWEQVELIAAKYCQQFEEPVFILSEGASVKESMPGSKTLAEDILRNEKSLGFQFDHVFIDAGTGFSAIALVKGMNELGHHAMIHVLLLADSEKEFKAKAHHWLGEIPKNLICFYPSTAKSFGAVNQTIKKEIRRLAYEEGILADPIYSAKLFYESKRYIESEQVQGRVLLVHSGGTLTMAGFEL
jgi:1-aminocyclopropane-1-carboxylate deaminase/D-cysteine desulfhydrase-like pyridoxal-dependent ACC family enzyme